MFFYAGFYCTLFLTHLVRFGKTLVIELFVIKQFIHKPSNKRNISPLPMKIFFSSGHEDYDGLRVELYQDADVFLVCFDIGNPDSLESAEDMVRLCLPCLYNASFDVRTNLS